METKMAIIGLLLSETNTAGGTGKVGGEDD
jgi:hypothetical protein